MKRIIKLLIDIVSRPFNLMLDLVRLCFATPLSFWYSLWFVLGGFYLYYNWERALAFNPFNGHSVIFIAWLVMIFRLFIEDFNSPWFSAKFKDMKKKRKSVKDAKKDLEDLDRAANQVPQLQNGGQI